MFPYSWLGKKPILSISTISEVTREIANLLISNLFYFLFDAIFLKEIRVIAVTVFGYWFLITKYTISNHNLQPYPEFDYKQLKLDAE